MEIVKVIVALAVYLAVLGFGIACAWLMHRRATSRSRDSGIRHSGASHSLAKGIPGIASGRSPE